MTLALPTARGGDAPVRGRTLLAFGVMAAALVLVAVTQSTVLSLTILNLCLISAVMALGLNIQWGYAGLFNAGVMGFAALGGLAGVLVSQAPVAPAWQAGGGNLALSAAAVAVTVGAMVWASRRLRGQPLRTPALAVIAVAGFLVTRVFFIPGVAAIEAIDPTTTGYLGGLGLPIMVSWIVGGALAAGAAFLVGRIALGLRSDYFAIATLGISEIVLAMLKNEEWLTRGVKNVTGLNRPIPNEIDLQKAPWFIDMVAWVRRGALGDVAEPARAELLRGMVIDGSTVFVEVAYGLLFTAVLVVLVWFSERALNSPWGRMMRAIRDNETAANAMGKDVTRRHRQIFIIGSAVVGIAGAMLTTLDGQFTPSSYSPLRFTFLIWVMVIVGGSGNNLGAVLGGFVIWFTWIEAEPVGFWVLNNLTAGLGADSGLRQNLLESAPHMRPLLMGLILLLVMRFNPRGLIPEVIRRRNAD